MNAQDYVMQNGTITTDTGNFYDSGGNSANYSSNENLTLTFFPETQGNVIRINFSEFQIEENANCLYDYMEVYNGSSTAAELIGVYCTGSELWEITATNGEGALTFVFISDGSFELTGWSGTISSVSPSSITEYLMSDMDITTDSGTYYDSGGELGAYTANETHTQTFYPTTSGNMLEFIFTSFDVETQSSCNFDWLSIYDGTSDAANLIGTYCNSNPPDTIRATNPDGALTFVFSSDGSAEYNGWIATINSIAPIPLVAEFTASATSGTAPVSIHFEDLSTGDVSSWEWDFNNDGIIDASTQNPSHMFDTAGTYTISLTVGDGSETATETKVSYITIEAPIELRANFSASSTNGIAPFSVSFTDESTGNVISWEWDFNNDGTIDATSQNPSFTFDTAGLYTVVLTISDGTDTTEKIKANYVNVVEAIAGTIISTQEGGDWNQALTWIGGVVPTITDNVIIDGNVRVFVSSETECNNLTINEGDTLTKVDGSARVLNVYGNLINNGVISRTEGELYTYTFTLNAFADVANNGIISNINTVFAAHENQYISTTNTSIWRMGTIENIDSAAAIIAGSDLYFHDDLLINLQDENFQKGALVLPADLGFNIYARGLGCSFKYIYLYGNNNNLQLTDQSDLWDNVSLQDINLYGNIRVVSDIKFIDNVTLYDTLQNEPAMFRYVNLYGTFINRGIIKGEDAQSNLRVKIHGDLINYGTWSDIEVTIIGESDQTIAFMNDNGIDGEVILDANISGASTYQWYNNGSTIETGINYTYSFDILTIANGGSYNCETDIGTSRNIIISGSNPNVLNADFNTEVTSGAAPLVVSFNDISTGTISDWQWDFDNDGTIDATEQNPSFTYNNSGTYSVKLIISDGITTDSIVKTDYITISGGSSPINEKLSDDIASIYPVVNDGSFTIKTSNTQIETIEIVNPQGIVVTKLGLVSAATEIPIAIPDIKDGIYYIIIKTEEFVSIKNFIVNQ